MKLEESTFVLYAMKYYDNPHCHGIEEFEEDLKRIGYVKKLLSKYNASGVVNERLVLNHLIVIYNCFGKYATNMLFYKLKEFHAVLKPFVAYLNYLPVTIEYEDTIIYTKNIESDTTILKILGRI